MEDNRDEFLVQQFFNDSQIKVEDDGFTRNVMRHLPDRARRLNCVWTAVCAVIGIILLIRINVIDTVTAALRETFGGFFTQNIAPLNTLSLLFMLSTILFVGGCGVIVRDRF